MLYEVITTDDDGKTHRIPAKCSFKVEVDAIAKVVSLPDMNLVKRIKLHGYDTSSTETSRSNCPISNAGYAGLASKAATEAVDYNLELKSLLAPTAQVLELRQCEEGAMVKIGVVITSYSIHYTKLYDIATSQDHATWADFRPRFRPMDRHEPALRALVNSPFIL